MNKYQKVAKTLFKNSAGDPLILKNGQSKIFKTIVRRETPRNALCCYTRYGKSMVVALGILYRVITKPEKWIIIGPKKEQAEMIMSHLIDHIFDNYLFYSQLEIDMALERLKRERRKDHLTFRRGGEVFILTADAGNQKRLGAILGQGCIPAGFKVLTDRGNIDIDEIVKNKENVKICSFNHAKNKVEYKDISSYQKNLLADRYLIEIKLGNKKIKLTNDHPVWVENKGYVPAEEIKAGDKVKLYDNKM